MRHLLNRFGSDQAGSFAVMASLVMVLVIACAALGVDVGAVFADRRKTQSAADLAAIVAASNITNATNAAAATVTQNAFPASALVGLEYGVYTADSAMQPQARFVTASAAAANAVRVTLQTATPLTFGRFLTGASHFNNRSIATAATTQMAAFSIGARLASLNGGLLNGILGGMLGTSLSLSVMDYQSLINARIDLFSTLSALATRVNLTSGTYNDLLNANVKVSDLTAAMQSASGASSAATVLGNVTQALNAGSTQIALGKLVDLGPYGVLPVTQKPKANISVSMYDMLMAAAQIANGTNQVAAAVSLGLPGIASATVTTTIGARPQGSGWIAVGTKGISVHTAQTRVLVTLQLVGSGSVSAVNLPVYVEVASGTATLNSVSCGYPDISASTVQLGVTPGIVDAWIGNITSAALTNFSTKPNPGPATLVNLGLVTVTGRAHAGIGNTTPTNVNFSYSDIQSQLKKTVTTTNFTSSLTGSLLGDLSVSVNVVGLGVALPGLGPLVTGIISGATSSIDQALAAVLATLGVGIGQADVWVSGVRCDGAVLVN